LILQPEKTYKKPADNDHLRAQKVTFIFLMCVLSAKQEHSLPLKEYLMLRKTRSLTINKGNKKTRHRLRVAACHIHDSGCSKEAAQATQSKPVKGIPVYLRQYSVIRKSPQHFLQT